MRAPPRNVASTTTTTSARATDVLVDPLSSG
jgi:hypothetical protein